MDNKVKHTIPTGKARCLFVYMATEASPSNMDAYINKIISAMAPELLIPGYLEEVRADTVKSWDGVDVFAYSRAKYLVSKVGILKHLGINDTNDFGDILTQKGTDTQLNKRFYLLYFYEKEKVAPDAENKVGLLARIFMKKTDNKKVTHSEHSHTSSEKNPEMSPAALRKLYGEKAIFRNMDELVEEQARKMRTEIVDDRASELALEADEFRRNGNYEKAIQLYNKAIGFEPDYFAARVNLGLAYYDIERFDEAIEQYTQALLRKPTHIDDPLFM